MRPNTNIKQVLKSNIEIKGISEKINNCTMLYFNKVFAKFLFLLSYFGILTFMGTLQVRTK